jgi:uncharacterized OsmC-like protein
MATNDIATALRRVEAVLERRPETGIHDDAPASARWSGGLQVTTRHANGTEVQTDMPGEFGGSGGGVPPGWLFRAGVAACATTSIAMLAALRGMQLASLEVDVCSQSDARGMFGMKDANGKALGSGPNGLQLHVRVEAPGADPLALRALIDEACARSPIPSTVRGGAPIALRVDVVDP